MYSASKTLFLEILAKLFLDCKTSKFFLPNVILPNTFVCIKKYQNGFFDQVVKT